MARNTPPHRAIDGLSTRDHSRASAGLTYVYPVLSRRARGVSIGINLNPNNACNWRCIYCQVPGLRRGRAPRIDLAKLETELRDFLTRLIAPPSGRAGARNLESVVDIAISGNGEPTSAREFPDVAALTCKVIREFGLAPGVRPRVITNGSLVGRPGVDEGLRRLAACGGEAWFKVDAGSSQGFARINDAALTPAQVVRRLRRCAALIPTWVQTCVFALDGAGPTDEDIRAYIDLLLQADTALLQGVLLYGLARPSLQPEATRLSPLPEPELQRIAAKIRGVGLTVQVSP